MRVFISYSSQDRPQVAQLVQALEARGIECWWDQYYIDPGTDIVTAINSGLDSAQAGIIVFSQHSQLSRWVEAESSYLTYARIQEGKVLIPVVIDETAAVPPLLRPLARRAIHEYDRIAEALRTRSAGPPSIHKPEDGRTERVLISLSANATGITVTARFGAQQLDYATQSLPAIPTPLQQAHAAFLSSSRLGARSPQTAQRVMAEQNLLDLGRALCSFCFPQSSGAALAALIDAAPIGTAIEVCFEADRPHLLALPFEALRLPDGRVLATLPAVVTIRRPANLRATPFEPLAGPLKILVAVGAPDEGNTDSVVLDHERELQNILNAVEPASRLENVQVRILEVGHPSQIAEAIQADAYHILHLSCHGLPGKLELEDEEGRAQLVTPAALTDPIRRANRPLPMVFLNSCHGGVHEAQSASFAEELLRSGVPYVLAMQASVTDQYATNLAFHFYTQLAKQDAPLPARALATARQQLEQARQAESQRSPQAAETPEFASAALFVSSVQFPLADFGRDKQPLQHKPAHHLSGPVPQLKIDDLIGRRKELRDLLRTLRDPSHQYAGAILTGLGGSGKSALAGRAMQRLSEEGRLLAAHSGRFDLTAIALAVGLALDPAHPAAGLLQNPDLPDDRRLPLLKSILETVPLVLVLDDFEQNLTLGGEEFLDASTRDHLLGLARSARQGRLLITCRYPVPGADAFFNRIPVGPLSPAETRKLILRLQGLAQASPELIGKLLRTIGGHPRILEFLDALLQGGRGRLPHVTEKLHALADEAGIDLEADAPADLSNLDQKLRDAIIVGTRDVFLAELLQIAAAQSADEVLLQIACSNLPVAPEDAARMLTAGESPGDVDHARRALRSLEKLSLVVRLPQSQYWVHRWTAQGLAKLSEPDAVRGRYRRAGQYRVWRANNLGGSLADLFEAVRNFLAGQDYDAASVLARQCFKILTQANQSIQIAAFAAEVLELLPEAHPNWPHVMDAEAQARLSLGETSRALTLYTRCQRRYEQLVASEPDNVDYQRNFSVFLNRLGDLYRDLGQGDAARQSFEQSLAIRQRLAAAEPDRADYQRDLSISLDNLGDLYRDLGQGDAARQSFEQSLAIAQRLAAAEPDRADYQRDLSVSLIRLGDLYRALGQGDAARQSFEQSLAIAQRLAAAEPDRADYQRDLSVSLIKLGGLYRDLGQGDAARQSFEQSLAIAQRLAAAEPYRADYQSDLSVSLIKLGDLYRALGQGDAARQSFEQSLAIVQRLAAAEPGRADFQRDLSLSHDRLGDLYRDLGQGDAARQSFEQSLAIVQRLAAAEPGRADFQRDLSLSLNKLGDLYRDLGQGDAARQFFQQSLAIRQRLAAAEPGRADFQRDLSVSLNKLGDLYRDLGQGDAARQSFEQSLAIRQRLAAAEPDRADYQRDLSISLNKLGDLYRDLGQGDTARQFFQQDLAIAQRLAAAEPDRADYQRDLWVSLWRLAADNPTYYNRALEIMEALHNSGRLLPTDLPYLTQLRQLVQKKPKSFFGRLRELVQGRPQSD